MAKKIPNDFNKKFLSEQYEYLTQLGYVFMYDKTSHENLEFYVCKKNDMHLFEPYTVKPKYGNDLDSHNNIIKDQNEYLILKTTTNYYYINYAIQDKQDTTNKINFDFIGHFINQNPNDLKTILKNYRKFSNTYLSESYQRFLNSIVEQKEILKIVNTFPLSIWSALTINLDELHQYLH